MVHVACLIVNISSVSATTKTLAVKVATSIHRTLLPCLPSCLVLCPLLALLLKRIFSQLICFEKFTFLRYLCVKKPASVFNWIKFIYGLFLVPWVSRLVAPTKIEIVWRKCHFPDWRSTENKNKMRKNYLNNWN